MYNIETDGKPCSEPTLVKAEDGSLRVYFVTDRGNLYLMRDQAGQTEADYELIYEKPAGDSTISEGQASGGCRTERCMYATRTAICCPLSAAICI
ncbi:MAG: hypothetical protein V8S96_04115 [Lachnospiraceae bacterium]